MTAAKQHAPSLAHDTFMGGATRFDFYASLVAAAVALIVGGMILADVTFLDLGRRNAGLQGKPIARVGASRNVVRKKSQDLPLWTLASPSDVLYADDYVFTDADSSVHLQFMDQDDIALDQNTMIQVRRSEGEASLGLLKGALRAEGKSAGKPLVIQVGAKGAVLRAASGTRFNVRAQSDGRSDIAVLSGRAEIQRGEETVTLTAAEVATTDAAGTVVKADHVAVVLDRPFEGERLSLGPTEAVTFVWVTPKEKQAVWFDLARDASFGDLVMSEQTTAAKISVAVLDSGTYHWRVRADATSEARVLTIARRAPPALLWPEDTARMEKTQMPFMLAWKGDDAARRYVVELATDPELAQPIVTGTSDEATLAIPVLPEGVYYWRVKEAEGGAWSAVKRFTVGAPASTVPDEDVDEDVLPPPTLDEQYEITVPRKGAFHWESLFGVGVGVAYAADDEAPVMRWPAVKDASAYAVQISKEESFASILREADVLAAFYSFDGFEPGVYFIRIATRNARGSKGAFSKPVRVVISHPAPRLVAPPNGAEFEPGVAISFDWRRVEGAKSYRVEIARDASFKTIVRTETPPLSSLEVKSAEAGSYVWRVSAVSKDGQVGLPSRVGRFSVAPAKVAPPAGVALPRAPAESAPTPPSSAPEAATASVVTASTPTRPTARRTFAFGVSPTQFAYEGERRAPAVDVDATLFNSFFMQAAWELSPRWSVDVAAHRTATKLFKDDARQDAIKMTPMTSRLAAVWRFSSPDAMSWWGFRGGLGHQALPRFSETTRHLVEVHHVSLLEPLIGVVGAWGIDARWRLMGALDYFSVFETADVTSGARVSGDVALLQSFSSSPYFAQYGLRLEHARYALANAAGGGEVTNVSRSLLIGLGLQL